MKNHDQVNSAPKTATDKLSVTMISPQELCQMQQAHEDERRAAKLKIIKPQLPQHLNMDQVENQIEKMHRKLCRGKKLSETERVSFNDLLMHADRYGIRLPAKVLRISDEREILQFLAKRIQSAKEQGFCTVYEHILNDVVLTSHYMYEKSLKDAIELQGLVDEYMGRLSCDSSPDLIKAEKYLRQLDATYVNHAAKSVRTLNQALRSLQNFRRSQLALQIGKVNQLNIGDKQINLTGGASKSLGTKTSVNVETDFITGEMVSDPNRGR